MPFLGIAYHTFPHAAGSRRERKLVVVRFDGREAEYFDTGSCRLMEHQPRLNDAGVVTYQQRTCRNVIAYAEEPILADLSVAIDEQFAVVSFRERVLRDAFVRQRIIVLVY